MTEAILNGDEGKAGDGKAEEKAFKEAAVAHRKAEALTKATARQANIVYQAVRGEPGCRAKAKAQEEIEACAEKLAEATDTCGEMLARIAELEGVQQAIEHSKRDDMHSRFRVVTPKPQDVSVRGQGMDASMAIAYVAQLAKDKAAES